MSPQENSEKLFPSIGEIASKADEIEVKSDEEKGAAAEDTDNEKVVQEVESLCMKCEEQVSPYKILWVFVLLNIRHVSRV